MKEGLLGFVISFAVTAVTLWWMLFNKGQFYVLFAPAIVALLIPIAMPSLKWLLGSAAFFSAGATTLWVQHIHVTSLPTYTGSPGDALGVVMFMLVVAGFICGAVIRIMLAGILAMRHRAQHGAPADHPISTSLRQDGG